MEVCDEVVDTVDVSVSVFDIGGDLEIVGDADCVLETEEEADTVEVILGVHVNKEVWVPEILVVEVLELELEPEFVGELDSDFDTIELIEYVGVWTEDLEIRGLPE